MRMDYCGSCMGNACKFDAELVEGVIFKIKKVKQQAWITLLLNP